MGPLYYLEEKGGNEEEIEVKEFIEEGEWNLQKLKRVISEEMVEFIAESISPKVS